MLNIVCRLAISALPNNMKYLKFIISLEAVHTLTVPEDTKSEFLETLFIKSRTHFDVCQSKAMKLIQ